MAGSESLLAGIVNNIVDGVITTDERGNVKTLNPAAERLFGYKAEEVIGHNVSMLIVEPYRSEHDANIARYLRTGEGKVIGKAGRVLPGRRKDGSMFQMDLAVTEFSLENRRYFVGIARDMTDRNRVTELANADRMKDEFLATLAHELRNPLAPIRNAVQMLSIVPRPTCTMWSSSAWSWVTGAPAPCVRWEPPRRMPWCVDSSRRACPWITCGPRAGGATHAGWGSSSCSTRARARRARCAGPPDCAPA